MSALDKIILVSGAARSGTSMTAGIIHLCGAFGGLMSGPTKNNKKGMFENADIRNHIVKPYLRGINVDPMGQCPLPELDRLIPVPDLRDRVEKLLYQHRYDGEKPVFYKGAKMCLIWPLWHAAFPDAKWVIVRRADEDIVYSCMRTAFMRAYRTAEGWQGWVDTHKLRFQQMHAAGLQIREVWPTQFVEGDFTEMKECIDWLGLEWDDRAVKDFICPELFYRNGVNDGKGI